MPPKQSNKRSRAPVAPVAALATPNVAADPASPRKRARKSTKAHTNLDENVLAADAVDRAAAVLALDTADRAFWEQFDTPLLWAWVEDYGIDQFGLSAFDVNQRSKILQTLVQYAEHNVTTDRDIASITRPKPKRGDSALMLMQRNFKHRHPKQPMPGLFKDEALSDDDHHDEIDRHDDDDVEEPTHPTVTQHGHSAHQHTSVAAAAAAGVSSLVECDTCLHRQRCKKTQWICTKCNLRGDLCSSDPTNVRLMAMLERDEARAATASSPAVHVSRTSTAGFGVLGQSTINTPSTKQLSALDREFERLETSGDAFDLFDDKSPVIPTAAIDEVRKCLRGLNYARPSPSLIKLIQSGKLDKPGYAASENNAKKAQGEADGTHVFSQVDGNLQLAKSVREPITFASMQQYVDALCATIIPSLIERPKAILQWLAVTRTMIQIEEKHGWSIAVAYLTDLLQDSVPQRRPFSAYSQEILNGLTYASPRPPISAATSVAISLSEHQTPSLAGNVCRNWNHERCTTPCPTGRSHTCLYQTQNKCDGKHIARNCPRKSSFSSDHRTGAHPKSNKGAASTTSKM